MILSVQRILQSVTVSQTSRGSAEVSTPYVLLAGTDSAYPTYVAIKGTVFDVSGNAAYAPKASYHGIYNCNHPPVAMT